MSKFIQTLIAASCATTLVVAQDEPPTSAATVQTELKEWVKTRQIISRERSEWESEKETLSDLNAIRKTEIEQLAEFIEAAGGRIEEVEKKRASFETDEQELKQWRNALDAQVSKFEQRLLPLVPRFPPPLREKVEEAVKRLEQPDSSLPLQNRTRDILLILQATLEFQDTITVDGEVREIDGERREIDIIYLGLTQAWYADSTGSYGGLGVVTAEGWEWVEDNKLAARIRKAIEIQLRQAPAEFIALPVLNGNTETK